VHTFSGPLLCIGVTCAHLKFCGYIPWFIQLLKIFAKHGDNTSLHNFKIFTGMSFWRVPFFSVSVSMMCMISSAGVSCKKNEDWQLIFAMWVLLLWGRIILLVIFFPTDTKKSFRIFAISVGFCLHSPVKGWVKLGGVEVALVKDWVAILYFQPKGCKLKNRFRWLRWWIWQSTL